MDMYDKEDTSSREDWLMSNMLMPVCPHCDSVYTYKYILNLHGYGCTDCGKDFGKVIKLKG